MYALWLSSRGTCVPLQSRNAQKRQTQLWIKMKTVPARLLETNRRNYQALFFYHVFTLILFVSNRLSGYRWAEGDFICPVKPIHPIY